MTSAALATGLTQRELMASNAESDSDDLKINIAGYQYDRVAGLADGRVKVAGCETDFTPAKIGDMNTHVFAGPKEREVTEIGLLPWKDKPTSATLVVTRHEMVKP